MPQLLNLNSRTVAGAVAGNITVTGIKKGDRILLVQPVNAAGANVASQFSATADDTINNTGGSSTATQTLLVVWEVLGGGRALGKLTTANSGRASS